jgi:TolB-like protein/Flp pilus assembly protein TadD
MKRCPQCNRVETDDALVFCRADGTALVSDSGPVFADSLKFSSAPAATEIETSILPHVTDSATGRATAPTTVLPAPGPPGSTQALNKSRRWKTIIAVIVVIALALATTIVALAVSAYLYRSRTGTTPITSIAVMPFVNEGGNAEQEYLADGITESLINGLSQLPNLKVMSRNSVFRYKGKETDAQKVGSELNVRALLTGNVKQVGDQLFINVSLDDTQDNHHIWGEQYNRKQSDLISLQSEIARDVSSKLRVKLSGADEQKLAKNYTASPEAYQLYLKGRFYWNKRTVDGLKQAAVYYKQAIEKDPGYALAYSGLAETYVLFANYSVASPKDSMPQAKAAALKALELDDSLAEPHAALGTYLSAYGWDQPAAERELRRAIELKPNYATAYHWLGVALAFAKRPDEAVAAARRAEELDPLSLIISADTAFDLILARRYDEAIAQGQRALMLDPNFYYTHYLLGWAYHEKGMYPEAISECRKSLELNEEPYAKAILIFALSKSGGRAEAIKLRDELKSETARRYVPSYFLAVADTALGDKDEAFAALEKDFAERSTSYSWIPVDPLIDDLRADPRFADLMQKVASSKTD